VTDKVKTFLALSDRARVSRLHSQNSIEIDLGAMTDGDLIVDLSAHEVRVDGKLMSRATAGHAASIGISGAHGRQPGKPECQWVVRVRSLSAVAINY